VPSPIGPSSILLLGACLALALAVALLGLRRGNGTANRILSGMLFLLSLALLDGFLFDARLYFAYPHLYRILPPFLYLIGPSAYLYALSLTSPGESVLRSGHLLHLLPFGMAAAYSLPFCLLSADRKIMAYSLAIAKAGDPTSLAPGPFLSALLIQMGAYLAASSRLIGRYSKRIKEGFSSLERVTLSWLRHLYLALFALWSSFIAAGLAAPRLGFRAESLTALRLMTAACVFALGIRGLARPRAFELGEVLRAVDGHDGKTGEWKSGKGKYRKSTLSEERSAEVLRKLTDAMGKDRLFLDPGLTLPALARRLGESPNSVSQVVNGRLGKSFYVFVNEHRVHEAKRLLLDPRSDNLSILGIAMDAGFNSKNAFYAAFKADTGINPSRFKALRPSL
jgi:AraC-like DNA-binding protein